MVENSFQYKEVSDIFHIKFGGSNEIDAQTFTAIMKDIIELSRGIVSSLEPDATVKINIKATHKGSFDTVLSAIILFVPTMFTPENINLAKTLTGGIVDIFNIKKFLKGEKPKNIETKGKIQTITNTKNEKLHVQKEIGNLYFNDCRFDNATVNIFNNLNNDGDKDTLEIKTPEKVVTITRGEYPDMAKPIITPQEEVSIPHRETLDVELLVKKPDLLGDSKWEFVFSGRTIRVKIEDTKFIEKVHNGEVKIYAGVKVPCQLSIQCELSAKYEAIPGTENYTILQVTGDIIAPNQNARLI